MNENLDRDDSEWISAKTPPDTSRSVMLRFDDDGSRDCSGFYWRAEGAWYKSLGSKARRNSVHPVAWQEIRKRAA